MIATPLEITPASKVALDQALRSSVWRASELAVSRATTVDTGYEKLNKELPSRDWPRSSPVELLVESPRVC